MKKYYEVDLKENRLTMSDARFYVSPKTGLYQPSVTTILDAYPKSYHFLEWLKKNGEDSDSIRDAKGKSGTVVHDLTERYDNGEEISLLAENGSIAMKLSEWNMFEKYVEFRDSNTTHVLENEVSLVDDFLGYGGTLDRVMQINKKKFLIDIKTSNYISNHYWLQLAALRELYRYVSGVKIDNIGILWLNANTRTEGKVGQIQGKGWQLLMCDNKTKQIDKYYKLFKNTHALWLEENEGMKPRTISYSLKHKLI